jgi:hypothetical protein
MIIGPSPKFHGTRDILRPGAVMATSHAPTTAPSVGGKPPVRPRRRLVQRVARAPAQGQTSVPEPLAGLEKYKPRRRSPGPGLAHSWPRYPRLREVSWWVGSAVDVGPPIRHPSRKNMSIAITRTADTRTDPATNAPPLGRSRRADDGRRESCM